MKKVILFLQILMVTALPLSLRAQTRVISGVVKDVGGVLPGASVVEKGIPTNGTTTDGTGKFKLTLRGSSNVLVVKFIGYSPLEYKVGGSNEVDITLQSNAADLNEITVVGFSPRARKTSTGAVSTLNATEIRTVPTANVQNTLAGRIPGITSVQSSGQPGKDASDFFIRGVSSLNAGNRPLILVDDIEYTYDQLQQINVNEIETIAVLKDASSTAIYGIKGANGVLIVYTRRGKQGAPKFNLRVEGGLQAPTRTPKFLNSYDAVRLIRQAEANTPDADGNINYTYSEQDLELFRNGTDPYGHPNTDWYNAIFRKYTAQANTNLDISGGTDRVKYFISGGAFVQNGNTKNFVDPTHTVNTAYLFNRYNFRSNIDLKANKTLNLRLDVTTRFSDINAPAQNNAIGYIYDFTAQTPFSAPFLNPNGSYAYNRGPYTPGNLPTINASLANNGYTHDRRTDYNVLVQGVQNLDAITDGLSFTARVAYASSESFNKNTNTLQAPTKNFPTFYYNPVNDTYTKLAEAPYVNQTFLVFGGTNLYTTNLNLQFFANYDKTFGDHHVAGLLLFNQTSFTDKALVPSNFRGYSGRVSYDYKQKFLFDFNAAYNGSDRFAASNRFGFFPAVGLGYVLSRESFFKDALPTFSLFKLRASFGLVGSDTAPGGRYIYLQNYFGNGATYNFGVNGNAITGISEGALSNPNVVWEKSRKLDIGLDFNMLNDHVSGTIDYFRDIRYDQFVILGAVPLQLGVGIPYINVGKTLNTGFDGQINYRGAVGKFQYNAGFVFSLAKNTILFQSEARPAYPYLSQTGKPIGQPFGYESLGFYTQADVDNVRQYIAANGTNSGNKQIAVPSSALLSADNIHPGDLKYADKNADGVIDDFDKTAIGNPNIPNTTLGLSLGGSYKGFSINVLFQGSFNYSYIITGKGIEPFQSQFQPIHAQAWTPETANTAQFPRLTTDFSGTVNSPSLYPSTFWLVNARYVRLKSLDVGYQLPSKLLPFHINNARLYLSGYNLITWSNFSKYQQDPEVSSNTAGDQYINARVLNLGIQLGF